MLITDPEMLASAAADLESIGSAISTAGRRAAGPTTGLLAAAHDEVSAAVARLFGDYGQRYQALINQAATFHGQFARTLGAAATAYGQAEVASAAAVASSPADPLYALIMGASDHPLPDSAFLTKIYDAYIYPRFGTAIRQAVYTPEQFWPATPDIGNTMTFGQSVAQGVTLLNNAITTKLSDPSHSAVVFGYSQSATIATNEINALMAAGSPYQGQLSFVLVGDPNNPDGGVLERFPGFYIPFLDVAFNGATPPNSPYPTTIYTGQYDPIGDFPQYPLNVISDLNAYMGFFDVHMTLYPHLTADQVANAVPLPTSPDYTGHTQYYMVMTQNLPLLQPIRDIPYVGPPVADLLQPDLRVLVDLGYADYGPGGNYANVPTPAGLFAIPNPFTVIPDLATGAVQGVQAAMVDLGCLPPSALPTTYPYLPSLDPHLNFYFGQPTTTGLSVLSGALGNVLHLIPPVLI